MSLDALPYTTLLILAEFSVGSLIAALVADARGMVAPGFVKLSAALVASGAGLTLLTAANVSEAGLEGYQLQDGLTTPVRAVLSVFLALAIVYLFLALSGRRQRSLQCGVLTAATGLAALGLLAYQISPPTWGLPGTLLSLLLGALALGLVNEAMVLGHWYLVQPKLPGRPLQELTFLLFAVLAVQVVLVIINAAVPAREVPESTAIIAGSLGSNPAFWLRVGVGLVFPVALAYMAWQSSIEHAMMSATGLLYIAVGAVFVGEVLARGLLFVTGSPV